MHKPTNNLTSLVLFKISPRGHAQKIDITIMWHSNKSIVYSFHYMTYGVIKNRVIGSNGLLRGTRILATICNNRCCSWQILEELTYKLPGTT